MHYCFKISTYTVVCLRGLGQSLHCCNVQFEQKTSIHAHADIRMVTGEAETPDECQELCQDYGELCDLWTYNRDDDVSVHKTINKIRKNSTPIFYRYFLVH